MAFLAPLFKALAQGGKWAFKHPKQIANVVDVGIKIRNGISDAKGKEAEYKSATTIEEVEKKYDELLINMTEDFEAAINVLQQQLAQSREETIAYQKKCRLRFFLMSMLGGIGIVVAILLAIFL